MPRTQAESCQLLNKKDRCAVVRGLCGLLCAAALLSGCGDRATDFSATPTLRQYDWGVRFRSTNPSVTFPLPSGWKFAPGDPQQPNTVRLTSADGACMVLLTRAEAGRGPVAARDALGQALLAAGSKARPEGSQQVGNLLAQRLDARFDKDVREQLFTMQTGAWLLTLVTVHSRLCHTSFDDTLRGFRAR